MIASKFFFHWEYYLMLDDDLYNTNRYVDHNKANYKCYSTEFAKIILTAGSEIDVVCKALCYEYDPEKKPDRIDRYRKILRKYFPEISSCKVRIKKLEVVPWAAWSQANENDTGRLKLPWWDAYNSVKHNRGQNFHQANLENTFAIVSALLILIDELRKHIDESDASDEFCYPVPRPNYLISLNK